MKNVARLLMSFLAGLAVLGLIFGVSPALAEQDEVGLETPPPIEYPVAGGHWVIIYHVADGSISCLCGNEQRVVYTLYEYEMVIDITDSPQLVSQIYSDAASGDLDAWSVDLGTLEIKRKTVSFLSPLMVTMLVGIPAIGVGIGLYLWKRRLPLD